MELTGLTGKVALVTGAGSGIGKATAVLLAQHGARVAALSHTADEVEQTAARAARAICVSGTGRRARAIAEADLAGATADAVTTVPRTTVTVPTTGAAVSSTAGAILAGLVRATGVAARATVVLVVLRVRASITRAASKTTAGIAALICPRRTTEAVDTEPGLTLGATDPTVVGIFLRVVALPAAVCQTRWALRLRKGRTKSAQSEETTKGASCQPLECLAARSWRC